MTLKDFAINYLNPFYLAQRFCLICAAGFCFAIPALVTAGGQPAKLPWFVCAAMAVAGAFAIRRLLVYRPVIANLVVPFLLVAVGMGVLSVSARQTYLLDLAFVLLWTPAILCSWNAIRPWGGGVSLHDMQKKMKSMS